MNRADKTVPRMASSAMEPRLLKKFRCRRMADVGAQGVGGVSAEHENGKRACARGGTYSVGGEAGFKDNDGQQHRQEQVAAKLDGRGWHAQTGNRTKRLCALTRTFEAGDDRRQLRTARRLRNAAVRRTNGDEHHCVEHRPNAAGPRQVSDATPKPPRRVPRTYWTRGRR